MISSSSYTQAKMSRQQPDVNAPKTTFKQTAASALLLMVAFAIEREPNPNLYSPLELKMFADYTKNVRADKNAFSNMIRSLCP